MSAAEKLDAAACKQEIMAAARKGGALIGGVADVGRFADAPAGQRPADLLPGARSVVVLGGAPPRAGDWLSPKYQHMEVSSFSDRIHSAAMRLARLIEDRFGYYALCIPPGTDRGGEPFLDIALAAELAGCGSRSLAGPVLNSEYGFMYYAALVTTLEIEPDPLPAAPACPAPACLEMWEERSSTPCLEVCPLEDGGCLAGRIEAGRVVERRYDRARCRTRVETYWIPGFQKVLEATLNESDREKQRLMLYSSLFTRTLWSMTYANASQGQCIECMRVCPVGLQHRLKK